MIVIIDRSKKIKAYLHNNIILVPGTTEVLGVILGSCVFGKDGIIDLINRALSKKYNS